MAGGDRRGWLVHPSDPHGRNVLRAAEHGLKKGAADRPRPQSADKVRGAGAFPVAQSRALPDGRAHGFAALANIGVLRAGRAQPLYLLTPPGRFALRATAHRADASLRRAAGRFGPSAQVPTGHALPLRACRGLEQSPKALCRSIFHERCERPKDARNAAFSKFRGFQRSEGAADRPRPFPSFAGTAHSMPLSHSSAARSSAAVSFWI